MKGSKRERPEGSGRWELRVYLGRDPVTHRMQQVSRIFRGTTRQADTALAALITESTKGTFKGTDATVADLLEQHFDLLERKGHSPSTLRTYRGYAASHIVPAIGRVKVRKLTAWDLDQLYDALAETGIGPASIRKIHTILSGALGQATKWAWCPANVARSASPPPSRPQHIVAPSADDVRRLVSLAETYDPVLAAMVLFAALTGARRGEICALRWTDIDLDAGTVRIARSLLDMPGGILEKSTKTHAERVLSLGDAGVTLLAVHRAMVDERARLGRAVIARDAFVFSERLDGATPISPSKLTKFFARLRNELKMPEIHLHSCRHFVATQLAARGDVSARTLAGRLGHADASVTLKVYASFFPAADRDAADHVGRALDRGR